VRILDAIMRLYSYLFHLLVCLFLLGVSALALIGGNHNLNLVMLPWEGATLTYWLLFSSLFGLLSLLLAYTGAFRCLFPVWGLAVFLMTARALFLSPYSYRGVDHFLWALAFLAGTLLALYGSLVRTGRRRAQP